MVNLALVVLGGAPLNVQIDKGDGTQAVLSIDRASEPAVTTLSGRNVRGWVITPFEYGFEMTYDTPGKYQVSANVSGPYNWQVKQLCPTLYVTPEYPEYSCNVGMFEAMIASSFESPIKRLRSEPIQVDVQYDLSCNEEQEWNMTYSFQVGTLLNIHELQQKCCCEMSNFNYKLPMKH